jgi:hypothetical protein
MQFLRPTSSPAKTALIYITVGVLTMVWTAVYWAYRANEASNANPVPYYWIAGFMATGLALFVIGLATGQIGRAARPAEAAPRAVVTAPPSAAPTPALNPAAPNQVATNQTPASQPAPVAVVPAAGAAGQLPVGSNQGAGS